MHKFSVRELTCAAMIAALYAVMGYLGNLFGLTFGPLQLRFAEALTVLPWLLPAATPAVFVGCLITNLLSPYGPLDLVIGSAATLLAAVWTQRMKSRWLAPIPPIVCNAVLVGFTIAWSECGGNTETLLAAWTFNGAKLVVEEGLVCYVAGEFLLSALMEIKPLSGLFDSTKEKR